MPRYTRETVIALAPALFAQEPSIAEACVLRSLLNGGHFTEPGAAMRLAEDITRQLINRFDVEYGVPHESPDVFLLPIYVMHPSLMRRLTIFVRIDYTARGGNVELYPEAPGKELRRRALSGLVH